jgi:hypothetical protein
VEPNHTTARKPGPVKFIQYSLYLMVNKKVFTEGKIYLFFKCQHIYSQIRVPSFNSCKFGVEKFKI